MKENESLTIKIFIPDGNPERLKKVEEDNWKGVGIFFPRSLFAEARQREELKRTGVYLLFRQEESGHLPRVYIGEGDPVITRLEQHAKNKDFWTHCVVFTSKDQSLNKAHVQYLESKLVGLAREAEKCTLDNKDIPQPPSLSESENGSIASFLSKMRLCLPLMDVRFFEKLKNSNSESGDLVLKNNMGIVAHGMETFQGFLVRKGSTALTDEKYSIPKHLIKLRKTLINDGVLSTDGDFYRLTQDYPFNSPSTAAGVLLAGSINGLEVWMDDRTGKKLKEIRKTEENGL